jgi:hypothetical protein
MSTVIAWDARAGAYPARPSTTALATPVVWAGPVRPPKPGPNDRWILDAAAVATVPTPVPTPTPTPTPPPAPTPVPSPRLGPGLDRNPFPSTSFLRRDISAAPVDPSSAAVVANIAKQVSGYWGGIAAVNAYRYNVPFVVVGPDQPLIQVAFNDAQGKGYLDPSFAAVLAGIPIPDWAVSAVGTDSALGIWQPSTGKLWELWQARKTGPGQWSAVWGGRIDNVSTAPGAFPVGLGCSASGLSYAGLQLRPDEVATGIADHAIGIACLQNNWQTRWWPANRNDGNTTDPTAPCEGMTFRLRASYDVEASSMTPVAKAIARTAKVRGLIDVDTAGAVSVMFEGGDTHVAAGKPNPWDAIFAGVPDYKQLAGFPWDQLELVQRDWNKP